MRKSLISSLLSLVFFSLIAQTNYTEIDKIALSIPEDSSKSTNDISTYLKSKLTQPEYQLRAAFVWIAKNIDYDIDKLHLLRKGIQPPHNNAITLA